MPDSSVQGVSVTAALIVVSINELAAPDALLATRLPVSVDDVKLVDLSHYRLYRVGLSVQRVSDPTFQLPGAQSSQVRSLLATTIAL